MQANKVLILGDGLLSTELVRQTGWEYLSRKRDGIDFTVPITYMGDIYARSPNIIINCIANTGTYSDNKDSHWDVNYKGVKSLIDFCNVCDYKLVQISTDYLYANSPEMASEDTPPATMPNWYSYTKLLADGLVQLMSKDFLIIRTTFKVKPYIHDKAWPDLVGNFDYIDVIAKDIITLVSNGANGVYNVGTDVKSMYELAKQTKPSVSPSFDGPATRPHNTTMNIDKLNKFKEKLHE